MCSRIPKKIPRKERACGHRSMILQGPISASFNSKSRQEMSQHNTVIPKESKPATHHSSEEAPGSDQPVQTGLLLYVMYQEDNGSAFPGSERGVWEITATSYRAAEQPGSSFWSMDVRLDCGVL